jgi:hypothetical protein
MVKERCEMNAQLNILSEALAKPLTHITDFRVLGPAHELKEGRLCPIISPEI